MMKKRNYTLLAAGLLVLAMAAGCGSNTGNADTTTSQTQETQTTTESTETQRSETASATETPDSTEDAGTEEKTVTGTIEEIKDFMFIVNDEDGKSYEFDFDADTKPDGLDQVEAGDKVQVTYTGEVSEVDPFTGTVISVEKQ